MSAMVAALELDVRLQARSNLYRIGVVVAALFGVAIRYLVPPELVGRFLGAFYLVAVGGTTYLFGASMVLLEKSERTLEALRASPLRAREYIAAKALTLSAFAVVEGAILVAVAGRGTLRSPLHLLVGILVLGICYTLVGIGQVAPHRSVTGFLFPGAVVVSLVLQLPVFYVAEIGPPAIWYAIPSQGPLLLLMGAFEPIGGGRLAYAVGVSAGAVWASYAFARARIRSHIGIAER
jgi:fluoroquinolone transport system permease protein